MTLEAQAQQLKQDFDEVYDKGRTDEWSDFWVVFQHNGERTNYYYAFYKGNRSQKSIWTDENFKPKYDIKPIGAANNMFYGCNFTDLKSILEKQGVVLDLSGVTGVAQAIFGECYWLTRLPIIDLSNASSLNTTFSYCEELIAIDELILNESGTQTFPNAFNACIKLKEVRFGGVIGQDISFLRSPLLSTDTVIDAVLHFKNYAGTSDAGKYTLTLHDDTKTAMANLGAIAEFGGKTYDAYLTDIGWNLA